MLYNESMVGEYTVDKLEKNKKTIEKTALIIGIIVIITAVIGLTYSFFTIVISGNDEATSTLVTTGVLDIEFTTSEYINNPNMMLIAPANFFTEADKSVFTVKNSSSATIPAKYAIYLTDISISSNFKSADLVWQLRQGGTTVANGDFSSIGANTEILIYNNSGSGISLPLGNTHEWTLYLGLVETSSDQSSLYNGNISLKVKVVATNQ